MLIGIIKSIKQETVQMNKNLEKHQTRQETIKIFSDFFKQFQNTLYNFETKHPI